MNISHIHHHQNHVAMIENHIKAKRKKCIKKRKIFSSLYDISCGENAWTFRFFFIISRFFFCFTPATQHGSLKFSIRLSIWLFFFSFVSHAFETLARCLKWMDELMMMMISMEKDSENFLFQSLFLFLQHSTWEQIHFSPFYTQKTSHFHLEFKQDDGTRNY